MAGNDSEGLRYGTIITPEKYYLEWKNFDKTKDQNSQKINKVCKNLSNKLEWQIFSLFDPKRFLDLIHNFVIFDKGIKKVCRHNQYFGIHKCHRAEYEGRKKNCRRKRP